MPIRKIAILGAGNGGCAAAADLTLRGHEVHLFSRSEKTLAPILEKGGITLSEAGGEKLAMPALIGADIARAVCGVDWIVVTAPAVAHHSFAQALAPHLIEGQRILLNPGHTGGSFHFAHALRTAGCKQRVRLTETVTLTYICRMLRPAEVEIYRRTMNLRCAAFPGKYTAETVQEIRSIFPNVIAAESVLETGFSNINAIMHPAGVLGNAGWIEQTAGNFLYYREGVTPSIAAWIEEVDQERLQILKRLGTRAVPFVEFFYQAGLTSEQARASGSIYQAIRESAPNRSIKAPPSLNHRYINEDVGYGLVPMAEIGHRLGVRTPVIDALITLASAATRTDYRTEGLTLAKMGLADARPEDLPEIAHGGFDFSPGITHASRKTNAPDY